jgi:hypothetical protein
MGDRSQFETPFAAPKFLRVWGTIQKGRDFTLTQLSGIQVACGQVAPINDFGLLAPSQSALIKLE